MKSLTVTLIIPTYRPGEKFRQLIKGISRQTVAPEKVLILNTEEQFFHPEDLEDLPQARVFHLAKEAFDHGGTRDWGAGMADTDLLWFMTMDAIPADEYLLENLKAAFENPVVGAAYACQLPNPDCNELEAYTRKFNYGAKSCIKSREDLESLGIKTFFCSNVCAIYRRSDYVRLGGFEKCTIFNEDMIFAGKLVQDGRAIAYCADAKVFHSHNYSGVQQLKRNFDLGVSQAEHPEIFRMAGSEQEGIRMVKETAGWLVRKRKLWLLPKLIWQSGCKFVGYRLGRNYRKLPLIVIRFCTMNLSYWEKGHRENTFT